mgnify:CR=1 FL=1
MKVDNEFIRRYTGVVECIVRQYGKVNNKQDLMQEGFIGLMEAAKRYDPSTGVRFESYASWWVRKYIREWILNNSQIVRLSCKTEDYHKPLTEDIETPLYEEDGDLICYADILTDGTTIETDLIRQEEFQWLKEAIEKLSAREQQIIRKIYGIGQKKVPQKQIAKQLGITPMTVWRIQDAALKKMKKMLV